MSDFIQAESVAASQKLSLNMRNLLFQSFIVVSGGAAAGFLYKFNQVTFILETSWQTYPVTLVIPNMIIGAILSVSFWLLYGLIVSKLSTKPLAVLLNYDANSFWPLIILFLANHLPVFLTFWIVQFFLLWKLLFFLFNISYQSLLLAIRNNKTTWLDVLWLTVFSGFLWHNMSGWALGRGAAGVYAINPAISAKYFQYPAWNPQMYAGAWSYIYGNPSGFLWYWLLGFFPLSPLMLEQYKKFELFVPYYSVVILSSIGMYFLLKKTFRLSRIVCIFGGMTYLLNFYMLGIVSNEAFHFLSYLLFPWVFFLADLSLRTKKPQYSAYAALIMHFPIAFFYFHLENFYIFYFILALFYLLSIFFYYEKIDFFPLKASFAFGIAHLCFSHFYLPIIEFAGNYSEAVNLGAITGRLAKGFGAYVPLFYPYFIGVVPAFLVVVSFFYIKRMLHRDFPAPRFLVILSMSLFVFLSLTSLGRLTPIPDWLASSKDNPFPYVHLWFRFAPGLFFFHYILACLGLEVILRRFDYDEQRFKWESALSIAAIFLVTAAIIKTGIYLYPNYPPSLHLFIGKTAIGDRNITFIDYYLLLGFLAVLPFFFIKHKTVRNFVFVAIAVLPLIHYMNTTLKVTEISDPNLTKIFGEKVAFSAKSFPYVRRNPRDKKALKALNRFIATKVKSENPDQVLGQIPFRDLTLRPDTEFKAKSKFLQDRFFSEWKYDNSFKDYPYWLSALDVDFLESYLKDEGFSRFLEIGKATNWFSFNRHLGQYANVVFDLGGNLGRAHAWRWFPQFDYYFPWTSAFDSLWFMSPTNVDDRLWALNLMGVKHLLVTKKVYIIYKKLKGAVQKTGKPIILPFRGIETIIKDTKDSFLEFPVQNNELDKSSILQLKNPQALPLMFLVDKYKLIGSEMDKKMKYEEMKKIDYRTTILLEEEPAHKQLQAGTNHPGSVEIIDIRGNIAAAKVKVNGANSFLFYSDNYHPNWTALIDGKKTKIYRADLAFKAVLVPKGEHIVWFEFRPTSLWIGFFLSALTLFSIIFYSFLSEGVSS